MKKLNNLIKDIILLKKARVRDKFNDCQIGAWTMARQFFDVVDEMIKDYPNSIKYSDIMWNKWEKIRKLLK